MRIRTFKSKILDDIGLILYKACLDIVYAVFLCTIFGYYKYFKLDLNYFRLAESWILYVALMVFTSRKEKNITSYFLLLQMTLTLAPMLTMYGLSNQSRSFVYLLCGAHCIQCILNIFINPKITMVSNQGKSIVLLLIFVIAFSAVALTIIQYGIPGLQALDLGQIYEIRDERSLRFPLSYLVPWFFGVVLPMGMLDSLTKKKFIYLFAFIATALYFYLVFARKSWFLAIFLILGFYILAKYDLFYKCICRGLPCIVGGLYLLYIFNEKLLILPSLFIRRALFVPADIKFGYFNFFQNRNKLYFAEGVIGKVLGIKSPFEKRISLVIGDELERYGSSCNTGYLADAYANLGVAGVIILSLLLIILLKVLDLVSKQRYFAFNFGALSYCLFSLNDSSFLTILLTGGMIWVWIFLILRHNKFSDKLKTSNINIKIARIACGVKGEKSDIK